MDKLAINWQNFVQVGLPTQFALEYGRNFYKSKPKDINIIINIITKFHIVIVSEFSK